MAWDWRSSYLEQAKSDYAMFNLIRNQAPLCQSLHYLQMATEKLAKGFLTRPEFQTASRFTQSGQFVAFVDSLLSSCAKVTWDFPQPRRGFVLS